MKVIYYFLMIFTVGVCCEGVFARDLHPRIASFWQGKNLSECPQDTVVQMTADYIYIAQHVDSLTRSCMVDTIVAKWNVVPLANTVVDYLGNYDSPMFNEELLISVLERLDLSDPKLVALKFQYDELLKNRVGTNTADFEFVDVDGHSVRLSEVAKGKTLLLFYDPDCDVCHDLMKRLAAAADLPWRVVAVSVDPERLTSGLPASWINGRADGDALESLYSFSHYPYALILDGMKVEQRDARVEW